ncbi:MAG: hypothetical protein A2X19_09000 [Bacteroidetes bacterium GWE2_39_28]|nr:MAG: hypothetical protein A2X19_09000 [Bacteroidetes bacterium GWE2_39_28]OFY12155.1 MAG: hypothetical protein A2X16_06295 [Bacteroidetes bacterium GWF2_39_10]OFZ08113.1 MAG: hypothetical protein A2322_07850 [Bacteroidetes bacterium RIFOXYB2_FULL_39_7]OFZ10353.1 MAG: hypothetical protein A2465_02820 [Bacteroidetes bacterium RIFOXYC2_FULL_39_11]HCT94182.1 hypothetical protein [Rikenellaceae bacterium]
MNYLAHIFLSRGNRQLQVGNFIGDFVKGKSHENYPPEIQQGILLHREIDRFTDSRPSFLETVEMLRPVFNRYSGNANLHATFGQLVIFQSITKQTLIK